MLSFVCFSSEGESEKKPRLFCVGRTSFDVPEYSIAGIFPLIQMILYFFRKGQNYELITGVARGRIFT